MKTNAILLKLIFIGIFMAIMGKSFSQQQQVFENKARTELQKKGITEEELRIHLAAKGIDINSLDNLSEEQILIMQEEIRIAIQEIEDKKTNKSKTGAAPSAIENKNKRILETEKSNKYEQKQIPEKLGGSSADSTKSKEGEVMETVDSIAIWGQHIFRNKSLALYRQANDINLHSRMYWE